jgi:hypothetical protein
MINSLSKHQLIKMYLDNSLCSWLLKNQLLKKGDSFKYGNIMDVTIADLKTYFEEFGYPGLAIPRKSIPTEPDGDEGETLWTLKNGVYTVWFIERGVPFSQFTTQSREEFETFWKKGLLEAYEVKLNYLWEI